MLCKDQISKEHIRKSTERILNKMNDSQIKNLAHFTHCKIVGFSKTSLLAKLEQADKIKYPNENELQQDKAHIRKLPTNHLLYVERQNHHAYILQDQKALNSLQHMTHALRAIKNNRMLPISFHL